MVSTHHDLDLKWSRIYLELRGTDICDFLAARKAFPKWWDKISRQRSQSRSSSRQRTRESSLTRFRSDRWYRCPLNKWRWPFFVRGLQEMEIGEVKFGFIPNSQDQQAWRFRRRYRLLKGTPCPQLVLVHYTRGQAARAYNSEPLTCTSKSNWCGKTHFFTAINPTLFQQPVRGYPLRHTAEPAVFVAGERAGQKVQPQGNMMHGQTPSGMPMSIHQQQAMVAHQNNSMEMMERRHRERQAAERTANPPGVSSRLSSFRRLYFSSLSGHHVLMMILEASLHWLASLASYLVLMLDWFIHRWGRTDID